MPFFLEALLLRGHFWEWFKPWFCVWLQIERAMRIFADWSTTIELTQMPVDDVILLQEFMGQHKVLPTTKKGWASLADGLYVCDDADLAKHFQAQDNVQFLWNPGAASAQEPR